MRIAARRTLLQIAVRLRGDRAGSMLVTYALLLPFIFGVTGLGIETGIWYAAKRNLQTQADAGALSGAMERGRGHPDYDLVSAAALKETVRNGFVNAAPNTLAINNPPASGPNAGDQSAVEVILSTPQSLFLSTLFLNNLTVRARSVAKVVTTGTACVLALDPSVNTAIQNQGNPTIEMSGCVLAANSTSESAIALSGSASLSADSLFTAGNISVSSSATLNLLREPTVHAWPLDDPYANVTIPALGSCDYSNANWSNVTLTIDPGVYCDGMNFGSNAHITLNPGTYYVDRGDVTIDATAVIRCNCTNPGDGVTFVLTSTTGPGNIGAITINGGADVVLNAPTDASNPYKGILVYQDRRAPGGQNVKFNGGSSMLLTGGIYIPQQTVQWSGGNAAAGSTCTQIIGRVVDFVGNSEIINTGCEAAGVAPLQIVDVRVVE